jgi:hypothetical protein
MTPFLHTLGSYWSLLLYYVLNVELQSVRNRSRLLDGIFLYVMVCCVSDPSPDACSAVQCLHCSTYYCNFCFATFENRAEAHSHVGAHNTSQSQDPFLPTTLVGDGQRQYREDKIKSVLFSLYASCTSNDERQYLALSVCLAVEDTMALGIDLSRLWLDLLASNVDQTESKTPPTSSGEQLQLVESESHRLSRLVGQAIFSSNDTAALQILSSPFLEIDLTYSVAFDIVKDGKTTIMSHSLLGLAALQDMENVSKALLLKGMSPLLYTEANGARSPLHVIIERGHFNTLQFIIDIAMKFDPNIPLDTEVTGYNALHVAARYVIDIVVEQTASYSAF